MKQLMHPGRLRLGDSAILWPSGTAVIRSAAIAPSWVKSSHQRDLLLANFFLDVPALRTTTEDIRQAGPSFTSCMHWFLCRSRIVFSTDWKKSLHIHTFNYHAVHQTRRQLLPVFLCQWIPRSSRCTSPDNIVLISVWIAGLKPTF
jgi:hypothetical protein